MEPPLLELRGLCTQFVADEGAVRAVDGVDLRLARGEVLGVVGESGCGKSVTFLSVLSLLPPSGQVVGGEVHFAGIDLRRCKPREMRRIRGARIAMVFQDALASLNPVYTVGAQIVEGLLAHRRMGRRAARARAVELLSWVGIPAPQERMRAYPHELSGGMRQRVMIAIALSCEPELLIADEPTTALDPTVQAQILELLARLKRELNMAIVLITHDLASVAQLADRVAVMYAGQVVEELKVAQLFSAPRHPYTQALLHSLPGTAIARGLDRLPTIQGTVPDLRDPPIGCRFADRCPRADAHCEAAPPPFERTSPDAADGVACFHAP